MNYDPQSRFTPGNGTFGAFVNGVEFSITVGRGPIVFPYDRIGVTAGVPIGATGKPKEIVDQLRSKKEYSALSFQTDGQASRYYVSITVELKGMTLGDIKRKCESFAELVNKLPRK